MATYYIAPDGSDSNAGTEDSPFATPGPLTDVMSTGDTAIFRGGVYNDTDNHEFWGTFKGSSNNWTEFKAYPGEQPIFDLSGDTNYSAHGRGYFHVANCSYVRFDGLEIRNFPVQGLKFLRSDNFEVLNCTVHHGYSVAFMAYECHDFYYENCEAYRVFDSNSSQPGNAADGFQATGVQGDPDRYAYNGVYENCSAHHCSDDGWDFFAGQSMTLIDCEAYANGYDLDGSRMGEVDSVGFKLGGGEGKDPKTGNTVVQNCVTWHNYNAGFEWNGAELPNTVYNCTSYEDHGESFSTWGADATGRGSDHEILNCIGTAGLNDYGGSHPVDDRNNSWNLDLTESDLAFQDTELDQGYNPVNPDSFLRLSSDSAAIDAGISLGEAYGSSFTDLGAYPFAGETAPGALRVHDGTQFTAPTAVRYYDGQQWVDATVNVATDSGFERAFDSS